MTLDTMQYKDWLRSNTNLLENSINLYARTTAAFFSEHQELTIENINAYVTKSFREKSSNYVKYSFKPLLQYKGFEIDEEGIPLLYKKIVAVKAKPRKKHGHYISPKLMKQVIANIKQDELQDIADLQYATGARASEIIQLREQNINWDFAPDTIQIFLRIKGNKEGETFLSRSYSAILEKYCQGKQGYLFLSLMPYAEEDEITRAVNTKRSYLYEAIQRSCMELGLDKVGTHDLRRNVAEEMEKAGARPRTIQKALNHSSFSTTQKYLSESKQDVRDAVLRHQEER